MKVNDMFTLMDESCQRGSRVCLGDLIDSIETDIFGILIFIPALITLFPISIIPGVSSLCALIVLFSTAHILLGREELWLPKWIRNITVSSGKVSHMLSKSEKMHKKIDQLSFPRYRFLTGKLAQKITCCAGIMLATVTLVLGFIPLVDIIFMAPVAFFGLGMCTQDGAAVGLGWGILGASLGLGAAFI